MDQDTKQIIKETWQPMFRIPITNVKILFDSSIIYKMLVSIETPVKNICEHVSMLYFCWKVICRKVGEVDNMPN